MSWKNLPVTISLLSYRIAAFLAIIGVTVIAEGVETQVQCDFLHEQGCHLMQGHLFTQPTAVRSLLEGLATQQASYLRAELQICERF